MQKLILASDQSKFEHDLQAAFRAGWQIVPGTTTVVPSVSTAYSLHPMAAMMAGMSGGWGSWGQPQAERVVFHGCYLAVVEADEDTLRDIAVAKAREPLLAFLQDPVVRWLQSPPDVLPALLLSASVQDVLRLRLDELKKMVRSERRRDLIGEGQAHLIRKRDALQAAVDKAQKASYL